MMTKMQFKTGEKFTIKVAANGITDAGVVDIKQTLESWGFESPSRHDLEFEWCWQTKRGTLPKRLARWIYNGGKNNGGKALSQKQLSDLGSMAARHCERNSEYLFDFTRDFNWKAGMFGDGGSCYWGDRSGARPCIYDNGGYAIRFWNPAVPTDGWGRCWILPVSQWLDQSKLTVEPFAMFNGYHKQGSTLITMARVLATHMGLSYQKIGFTNSDSDDTLYLNSDSAFLVGMPNELIGITSIEMDICMDDYTGRDDTMHCEDCGEDIDEDDHQHSPSGNDICQGCYDNHYFYCDSCSNDCDQDHMASTHEGESICRDCAYELDACNECGTYIIRDRNKNWIPDENNDYQCYCPDCESDAQDAHDERVAQQEKKKENEQTESVAAEVKA